MSLWRIGEVGVAVVHQRAFYDLGNEIASLAVVRFTGGLLAEVTTVDDDVAPDVIEAELERLAAN